MDKEAIAGLLKAVPSVDKILEHPATADSRERFSRELLKGVVRIVLEDLRRGIRDGRVAHDDLIPDRVAVAVAVRAHEILGPTLRRVINATGVIVHTNLGRSPLAPRALERVVEIAGGYSNLEYNLEKGRRGERNTHLARLVVELTGAQAAMAVNNNAAALLLALAALAHGREVIVSRGELIEIGGSFRIPDVMAQSGAILREVGTTNRTHPKDYIQAINERTALILKVHTSNYRIMGFTREVSLDELAAIGAEHTIPTMMDLGSGCLVDLREYGLSDEPTVQETVAKGIDVVSFSGDKLLGGPQAGILAGKRPLIDTMRTHPLARALRMDKLTLAALEATLEEYTYPDGPFAHVPTLRMIGKSAEELLRDTQAIAAAIESSSVGSRLRITIEPGVGRVGGGALPMSDLPGPRVAIHPLDVSAASLESALRKGEPPLIALIKDDAVLLDPRTILPHERESLPRLLVSALTRCEGVR